MGTAVAVGAVAAGGALVAGRVTVAGRALVVPRRQRWPRAARRPGWALRWRAGRRGDRRSSHRPEDRGTTRWQVVTVGGPAGRVLPGGALPEPLARLGDAVEVRTRRAPAGRGTELAARPRDGTAALTGMAAHLVGDDPGLLIRSALRQVRQLAETGEVLRADRPPAERGWAGRHGTHRPPPDRLDGPAAGHRAGPR